MPPTQVYKTEWIQASFQIHNYTTIFQGYIVSGNYTKNTENIQFCSFLAKKLKQSKIETK